MSRWIPNRRVAVFNCGATTLTMGIVLACSPLASADTPLTEHTVQLSADETPGVATIDQMTWILGAWQAEALGGVVEESWMAPKDGAMVGMFRLVRDDKVAIYELQTMSEVDKSVELKVKHFNAKLEGWEAKDEAVTFRFVKRAGNRYYFTGLTFEVIDADHVTIYLAMKSGDDYQEAEIKLQRPSGN